MPLLLLLPQLWHFHTNQADAGVGRRPGAHGTGWDGDLARTLAPGGTGARCGGSGWRERRARLGRRHHLAAGALAGDPLEVARGLVALHATDPTSVYVGAWARMTPAGTRPRSSARSTTSGC